MVRGLPSLQTFIEGFVGGNYVVAVNQVTVTTSPTRILQNNMERMAATIIVTGLVDIHLSPTPVVTASNGILLGNSGGNLTLVAQEDLALVGWDWWGICASGSSAVTFVELTRYYGATP